MLSFKKANDLSLHCAHPVGLHCSWGSKKKGIFIVFWKLFPIKTKDTAAI